MHRPVNVRIGAAVRPVVPAVQGTTPRSRARQATVRSLLRHQLLLQLGNAATAVLAMAWVLLAGRTLAPAPANEFFASLALATIAGGALGAFRSALGRECARLRDDPVAAANLVARAEARLWSRGGLVAVASALVLAGTAPRFGFTAATAIAIVAAVLGKLVLDARRAGLAGSGRYGVLAGNGVVEAVVRVAVGLACISLAPSAASGLAAYAVASWVAWLAIGGRFDRGARTHGTGAPWPALRALLVWNALVAVAQHVDTPIVAALRSVDDAAAFGACAALLRGFALIALPVQMQLTPHLTSSVARGRFDHRAAIGLLGLYLALAALPCAACLAWPEVVLELAYGDAFLQHGVVLLGPMACGAVLVHLGVTMAGILVARGRFGFVWSYGGAVLVHAAVVGIAAAHDVVAAAHAVWIGQVVVVVALWIEVIRASSASGDGPRTAR